MTVFPQDDSHQFARLLLDDGLIRQEDWQIAESIQHVQGGRILEILLGLCPLSEEELYRAIARQLDLPFWTEQDLQQFEVPESLLLQFPVSIALECDFLPVRWEDAARRLHVVLPNPLDETTLETIQMYSQCDELVIGVATPSDVVTAIQVHYKQGQVSQDEVVEAPLFSGPEPAPDWNPPEASHVIAPPKVQLRECPACHNMEPISVDTCGRCGSPMDLSDADPLLGKVINGFRLNTKLGEGGMGLVYGARQIETDQEAAVKILRTHLSSNERVVRRFHREAQAQNQLRHPNIVHVHDFGFEKGIGFFIAMEFLRGLSMEEILEGHMYKVTPLFIRAVIQQVCDAMGLAHSRGIYHRDLKPDNIFLLDERDGEFSKNTHVKILDFGVAKMVASEEDERLTRTGMTIGTPRYMAPEQAGDGNTDHRSDIYSLGVILFEMLTGKPPFEGSSAYQIMLRHVYADPPALSHVRSDLPFPPALEDAMGQILAKSPHDRPASMDLLWQTLAPALEQFEAALEANMPLHVSDHLPARREEPHPSMTSEPPVLVGRIIPNEPKREPASTPAPPAAWQPPPAPAPRPEPMRSSPSAALKEDQGWLNGDDLDQWESDLFLDEATPSHQPPPARRQTGPAPMLPPTQQRATGSAPALPPTQQRATGSAPALPPHHQRSTGSAAILPPTHHRGTGPSNILPPQHVHEPSGAPDTPFSHLGGSQDIGSPLLSSSQDVVAPLDAPMFGTFPEEDEASFSSPNTPMPGTKVPFSFSERAPHPTPDELPHNQSRKTVTFGGGTDGIDDDLVPASAPSGSASRISLRSGPVRTGQRNRFSGALKKEKPKKGEGSKVLLMIVVGFLLFAGGLAATWLLLMRGG